MISPRVEDGAFAKITTNVQKWLRSRIGSDALNPPNGIENSVELDSYSERASS